MAGPLEPIEPEPHWWRPRHSSAWERAKRGVRHRFVSRQQGTAQGEAWEAAQPAIRFGYGSRLRYADEYDSWDEGLEARLKAEWEEMKTGRLWHEVREFVQEGWGSFSDEEKASEPPVGEQDTRTDH